MEKQFAVGETLFREGDPSDRAFRIISGRIAIMKERSGGPLVLGRVREGEFLGEMGVVEEQPRSATARAETLVVERRIQPRPEARPAAPVRGKPIAIRGGSYALQLYIGTSPVPVPKMPYSVGRVGKTPPGEGLPAPDLGIVDPEPFRLSPMHFVLFEDTGKIFIRDCNSELGTIVNNRHLGRDFAVDQVALRQGENVVVAGGDGSPYKFLIDV